MGSEFHIALQHLHSMLRWLLLVVLIFVVITSFIGWKNGKIYTKGHGKLVFYTVLIAHLQLITGLVLYFLGPWANRLTMMADTMRDPVSRFFAVEHLLGMLIAIVLITIGSARAKRVAEDAGKYKVVFTLFGIALLLILLSIPWPFREVGMGRGWF